MSRVHDILHMRTQIAAYSVGLLEEFQTEILRVEELLRETRVAQGTIQTVEQAAGLRAEAEKIAVKLREEAQRNLEASANTLKKAEETSAEAAKRMESAASDIAEAKTILLDARKELATIEAAIKTAEGKLSALSLRETTTLNELSNREKAVEAREKKVSERVALLAAPV